LELVGLNVLDHKHGHQNHQSSDPAVQDCFKNLAAIRNEEYFGEHFMGDINAKQNSCAASHRG